MSRPEPGLMVAAGLVATALVVDVVLIRSGRDPISSCVRRSKTARWVTVFLAAHLTRTLRWDPLTALGRVVERR